MDNEQQAANIRKVQAGDMRAFESLMHEHMHTVRAFLSTHAPAQHLIDDLTHDAFVFAYRNIDSFNAKDAKKFKSWLIAIARNLLLTEINKFKREKNKRTVYEDFLQDTLNEGHEPDTLFDKLQDCLQKLPQPSAKLLQLRYHDQLSGQEIAEKLERSHSWVKVNLHRIHGLLRKCMKTQMV